MLVISKELLIRNLLNEQFKQIICKILKQPYWIHLYPDLYHQLYVKLINVSYLYNFLIPIKNNFLFYYYRIILFDKIVHNNIYIILYFN